MQRVGFDIALAQEMEPDYPDARAREGECWQRSDERVRCSAFRCEATQLSETQLSETQLSETPLSEPITPLNKAVCVRTPALASGQKKFY